MTEEQSKMLDDIHGALFAVPPGSPKDTKPLIEEIRVVILAYRRGSWAVRALVWALPTLALVGTAIGTIRGWLK